MPAPTRQTEPIALRIRFVAALPTDGKVRRTFKQSAFTYAVDETVGLDKLLTAAVWPEPTDHLHVVILPDGCVGDWQKMDNGWLARPDHPEAVWPVVVKGNGMQVCWRPGRALVSGAADHLNDILAALTDFAFFEGELRKLEADVEAREPGAHADVASAHRARHRDRRRWQKLCEQADSLARLRLNLARLKPRLAKGAPSLPPACRALVTRLLRKADVPARVEALDERLATCEELYEGANNRVNEQKHWLVSHILEAMILLFVVLGVAIAVYEIHLALEEAQPTDGPTPSLRKAGKEMLKRSKVAGMGKEKPGEEEKTPPEDEFDNE